MDRALILSFPVKSFDSFHFKNKKKIKASHEKSNFALHATVEYLDVVTKLRVGRTYFLRKNVKKDILVENVLDDMDDLVNYKLGSRENDHFLDEE